MKILLLSGFFALVMALNCLSENNLTIDFSNMEKLLPNDKNVITGTLPNGMKYFIRKNNLPENRAHFRLVINAGAIEEDDDQNGLAHFIEHMAFNGTKNFPENELIDFLQKNGITFGSDINASTSMMKTLYELPIPMNDENLVISSFKILSDWASNMTLEDSQIDAERGVIMSEWRVRNTYQFRMMNNIYQHIYKDSKLCKRSIIGDTSVLQNFKYDVIRRFYKDWYRPDVMALVAVGDFDANKIESMIKEYFGSIPNPANPRKREEVAVKYQKEPVVGKFVDKEIPMETGRIYFRLPEYKLNTYQGFKETVKRTLFDMMFNDRIQELSKSANPPFIEAGAGESNLYGKMRAFTLFVSASQGALINGMDAVLGEIMRVKQHGFTLTEYERAKKVLKSEYDKYYAEKNTVINSRYVQEYTNVFTNDESFAGIEFEYAFINQILPIIPINEINDLANLYIKKENTVITVAYPENDKFIKSESELLALLNEGLQKKTEPYTDKAINKQLISKHIFPGKIVEKKIDKNCDLTTYKLSNGAKVVLKKTNFKDDEIIFDMFSKGGYSYLDDNKLEKCSLADLIVSNSGVGELDATSLEKLLSGKNINVRPYIEDYKEGISGSSSKTDFETAMQLVHLIFTEPRKDKNAFTSFISKTKGSMSNKDNDPESVFEDSVMVTLYNHNFRKMPLDTNSINKINLDEVYNFYKQRFKSAGDFTFVLVGDIEIEVAEKLIEKYIASLPSEGKTETYKDVGVRYVPNGLIKEYKKGKLEKTHLRMTIPTGFTWNAFERQRINATLDLLRIKAAEIIREKMGGTYSPVIYPKFTDFPNPTVTVVIEYVCKPEMTNDILKATYNIFDDLKNNEDIIGTDKIKNAQSKSLELRMKNNNYWLNSLTQYLLSNEDIYNFLKYGEYISSLQPKDIKEKAAIHLLKEKAIIVINEPEQ